MRGDLIYNGGNVFGQPNDVLVDSLKLVDVLRSDETLYFLQNFDVRQQDRG